MTNKEIRKIAFSYVPETCPAVDQHIDDTIDDLIHHMGEDYADYITDVMDTLRERIKADGTILLREGLISAIVDYEDKLAEASSGV